MSLGISMAAMARRLNTVAVSKSVAGEAEIAKKEGLGLD